MNTTYYSPENHDSTSIGLETQIPKTSIAELSQKYDALLFDAFGVLIDGAGALPGARDVIDQLNSTQKPYFLVTNTSSKPIEKIAQRFEELSLRIPAERIISSGSLITDFFHEQSLVGAQCWALGSPASLENITRAGGVLVDLDKGADAQVFIISDLSNPKELFGRLEMLLNYVTDQLRQGKTPYLLIANPDPSYPKAGEQFGFAPGSIATMVESALQFEFPAVASTLFHRLGKPHTPIFKKARQLSGTDNMVMIGDHLATDIQGAVSAGLDSALVNFQIDSVSAQLRGSNIKPTYLIDDFK
jgi:HAD superfamily hydrolase (TIGR01450 family)